jgi:hypothetical protein
MTITDVPITSPLSAPDTPDEWAAWLSIATPGPDTAVVLPLLDPDRLSPTGRIDALKALERHAGWIDAQQVRLLASLDAEHVDPFPDFPQPTPDERRWDFTCEQVACALRLSNTTAATRLGTARALAAHFPPTLGLLERGDVHYMQTHALVEVTSNLDTPTAQHVEALVLDKMPHQSVSATRKALHRAVLKADPDGAEIRHQSARANRHVSLRPDLDGMSWWSVHLPAEQAAQIQASVDAHASVLKRDNDPRTLNQRRADAAFDLLVNHSVQSNGTNPTSPTLSRSAPIVQITVPYDTLIGTADHPADLKGHGPLTAGQARALASHPNSIWRRLLIHPTTGTLIKTDPTTYRPTADLTRHITTRDPLCTFPSCRMPSRRCDLDHVIPFGPPQHGPTTPDNLIPLCRRHHLLKHRAGWRVKRDPETGRVRWTAPTGHVYVNEVADYRT